MRKTMDEQMVLGQVDISKINFDLRSRDEITKILLGLQHIYCNKELRKQVFDILEKLTPRNVSTDTGRPGMTLWKILVLGILRLNCNWDYDKLQNIANNHLEIRQMLGHPDVFDKYRYPLQTIKDNISLFTPEILDEINQVVVKAGHKLYKKKTKRHL